MSRAVISRLDSQDDSAQGLPSWGFLAVGCSAALLGLLPWLVAGMWLSPAPVGHPDFSAQLTFTFLPVSPYSGAVMGMLVFGAALAGFTARLSAFEQRGQATLFTALGLSAVNIAAVTQSVILAFQPSSQDEFAAELSGFVLIGMAIAVVLSVLVLISIALGSAPVAAMAAVCAAIAARVWVEGLLLPERFAAGVPSGIEGHHEPGIVFGFTQWLPAVFTGLALVWCGVNSFGKLFVGLTILLAPLAVYRGLIFLSDSVGLPGASGDLVALIFPPLDFFSYVRSPQTGDVPPLLLAVSIAVFGAVLQFFLVRRQAGAIIENKPR